MSSHQLDHAAASGEAGALDGKLKSLVALIASVALHRDESTARCIEACLLNGLSPHQIAEALDMIADVGDGASIPHAKEVLARAAVPSKTEHYEQLALQLKSLLVKGEPSVTSTANFAALLYDTLPDLNWAGFYLLDKDRLILGPFQGRPACTVIPLGKGVCGTAAQSMKTVVVENVHEFPGHIACDSRSNSEIVVPVIKEGSLLGVLDLDSPLLNRFDHDDAAGLQRLVEIYTDALP